MAHRTANACGGTLRAQHETPAQVLTLWCQGETYEFSRPVVSSWARTGAAQSSAGSVTSPLPGKIVKVLSSLLTRTGTTKILSNTGLLQKSNCWLNYVIHRWYAS